LKVHNEGDESMTTILDKEGQLTPHARKLYDALKEYENVWLSRSEIADSIGKNRLTPYDIQLLESFADLGLGQARKVEIKGTIHWQYRAISQV
jgi:hypothetical protein